jgi:hypothetical protein
MRPLFEALEPREFFSASVAEAVVVHAPVTTKVAVKAAATPAKKSAKKVVPKATVVTPAPVTWNDLAGNWTGTCSNNLGMNGTISASFKDRVGVSNTGTVNLAPIVGQNGLVTTTTPNAYGDLVIIIPCKGGFVSLVGGITTNGQLMTGRWCSYIGTVMTVGYFTMNRV